MRPIVAIAVLALTGCGRGGGEAPPVPAPAVDGLRFVAGPVEVGCPDPYALPCVQDYLRLASGLRPEVVDWPARDRETLAALEVLREGGAPAAGWEGDWLDVRDGIEPRPLVAEAERRLGWDALLGEGEVALQLEEGAGGVARGPSGSRPYQHFELHLQHPLLGGFGAALRLPEGRDRVPVVIVLPGHLAGDGFLAWTWERLAGERLVAEGFGLLVARPRGADAGAVESAAAVRLIGAGHSLVGAHSAEAWLLGRALERLRRDGRLPPGRTGLFGHSSGALAGNILCHLASAAPTPPFVACANDLYGDYFKLLCEDSTCRVLDETDPRLRGLRRPLSAPPGLPALAPRPAYGLQGAGEVERLLAFFEAELRSGDPTPAEAGAAAGGPSPPPTAPR